jgi:transcriptional regulator with XRE-family HTH domain
MHALAEYLWAEMASHGWKRQAELVSRSGLTKQTVSKLMDRSRDSLGGKLDEKTIAGLAKALSVDESIIIRKAAEAMGIPLDRIVILDPNTLPDDVLLELLRRRLSERHERLDAQPEQRPIDPQGGMSLPPPGPTFV